MSVTTTADEKLKSARDHVEGAIAALSEIVVDQCWGHDDFNGEFAKQIEESFDLLRQIRKKLR
jgi:hypothetical protein